MDRQLMQILAMGLAVVLLVGGIALWQSLRLGGHRKAREAIAAAHAWTYTEHVEGTQWRMEGEIAGVPFVADAIRPRHDGPAGVSRPNRTRLTAEVAGEGGILVEPTGTADVPAIAMALVKRHAGPAAEHLRREGRPVPVEGPLAERFEVRATSPELAEAWLTDEVRAALVGYAASRPAPPTVSWWDGQLEVAVGEDLRKGPHVQAFLDLARVLVEAART